MSQGAGKARRPDDPLSEEIIGACIEIHRHLGPGLLESAYQECLEYELSLRGIRFRRQLELPMRYKELNLNASYRIDLLVEDRIIVELKAVEQLLPVHIAQVITYLKLSGHDVGLLINFNVALLAQGVRRLTRKNAPSDLPSPRLL
jgi:GxxExxY protein